MRTRLEKVKEWIKANVKKLNPLPFLKAVLNKMSLRLKITISATLLVVATFAVLVGTGVIDLNPIMPQSYLLERGLTKVPALVNKEFGEAEQILTERELNIQIVDKQYSDEVAEGMILSQSVKKGTVLHTDEVVAVIISAGYEQVRMPELVGYTKEYAVNKLADNGIGVEIIEEDSDQAPGMVLAQSIEPKEFVRRGEKVKLTVSAGLTMPEEEQSKTPEAETVFAMPDVQYKQEEMACKKLQDLGLAVETAYEENAQVCTGNVISQSVEAHAEVAAGDKVTLTISLGKKDAETAEASGWSGWMLQLPVDITASEYEIENKKQFSFRDKIVLSSLHTDIPEWTQFDSVIVRGEFEDWGEWATQKPEKDSNREIEQKTQYAYSDYETETLLDRETYEGFTLVGEPEVTYEFNEWSDWSEWSTEQPQEDTYREQEQKTQYQVQKRDWQTVLDTPELEGYTLDESKTVVEYGQWSQWSETPAYPGNTLEVQTQTETREVETGYTYSYFKYTCNGMFSYREDYAEQMGHGNAEYVSTTSDKLFAKEGRKHVDPNTKKEWLVYKDDQGGLWFLEGQVPIMGNQYVNIYRSRTITTTYWFYKWSDWSEWGDEVVTGDEDTKVNERTVYRYRDQIPHYYYDFERWTPFSEFSDEEVSESKTRKVQTRTVYRYRDREKITVFDYYKWGAWSDWRDEAWKSSDSREVQQRVVYRYKKK